MNVKLLVDAIVRQTTVLIAQLSTTAGVRAPLAHLADQVFLTLSREIEAQGVKRSVAADMFGLALRSYQKEDSARVQQRHAARQDVVRSDTGLRRSQPRLQSRNAAPSLPQRQRSRGHRRRSRLVQSGLLYSTGSGLSTLYGVTTEAERQQFTRRSDVLGLASMALGLVYRASSLSHDELAAQLNVPMLEVQEAMEHLVNEGRVEAHEGNFRAAAFLIDEDAEHGWEAAAFDHFQAVATALANKVALRSQNSEAAKLVSGTTLHFDLTPTHPLLPKCCVCWRKHER